MSRSKVNSRRGETKEKDSGSLELYFTKLAISYKEDDESPKEKIGKYSVKKEIVNDTLSSIYLVEYNKTKYILKENKKYKNHEREDRIYSHLGPHKYICDYYGSFKFKDRHFIVLKYFPGGNLFNIAQKLSDAFFYKKIVRQIVDVLFFLKKKGVAYLDLKPENILYDSDNQEIKLIDFAFSLLPQEEVLEYARGTPIYFSPELVRCSFSKVGCQTDIWALGILLWEIYTGIHPLEKYEGDEVGLQIRRFDFESFSQKIKFPKYLKSLIRECLIQDPDERITIEQIRNHKFLSFD